MEFANIENSWMLSSRDGDGDLGLQTRRLLKGLLSKNLELLLGFPRASKFEYTGKSLKSLAPVKIKFKKIFSSFASRLYLK